MSRLRDGEEVGELLACITCNKPLGVVQRGGVAVVEIWAIKNVGEIG